MKILQLCKKFPYPLKDGESIAVTYLSKALHELDCEITLLAMNTVKHYFDVSSLPTHFDHYKAIHLVELDNRIKAKDALINLFSSASYHVVRYISPEFSEKLKTILKTGDFDVVQLETVYLAPYIDIIKENSNAIIVQRSHNVEFEIWERIAYNERLGPKKWYLNLLAKRLRTFETEQLNRYDLMLAITSRDLERFRKLGCLVPGLTVPIGLKTSAYREYQDRKKVSGTIGFIGSMDWMPNIEGVQWFLDKVWPKVVEKNPGLVIHFAGRNTPDWLKDRASKQVVIEGEIDDALEFMATKEMMIVPLLSGGGMKVKIIESLFLGVLTISTSLGLEGIPAKGGKEILIADAPEEFADKIEWTAQNPTTANGIAEAGKQFAISNFDNLEIGRKVLDFFQNSKVKV
ncbi:MAG: glycosyltransferase family 4 protein [Bacteroidota bacterium]